MIDDPCHYCGRSGLTITLGLVVCERCVDLPRREPAALRERPLQRLRARGLA